MSTLAACSPAARDDGDVTSAAALHSSERAELFDAVDDAIAELDNSIWTLQSEIQKLETTNAQKLAQINSIISQIEQRKREIEENQRRKRDTGLLLCMFGACDVGVVSLATAIQDDGRIRQLTSQLATARRDQAAVSKKLAEYRKKKQVASAALSRLRAQESLLRATYSASAPPPTGEGSQLFEEHPELPTIAQRRNAALDLETNLEQQVDVLTDLRDAAAGLAAVLDVATVKVNVALAKVTALKEASDEELYDLVRMVGSDDPGAPAEDWLQGWLEAKTKEVMRTLGFEAWDPDAFVELLIKRSFPGQEDSPAARALAEQLKDQLKF